MGHLHDNASAVLPVSVCHKSFLIASVESSGWHNLRGCNAGFDKGFCSAAFEISPHFCAPSGQVARLAGIPPSIVAAAELSGQVLERKLASAFRVRQSQGGPKSQEAEPSAEATALVKLAMGSAGGTPKKGELWPAEPTRGGSLVDEPEEGEITANPNRVFSNDVNGMIEDGNILAAVRAIVGFAEDALGAGMEAKDEMMLAWVHARALLSNPTNPLSRRPGNGSALQQCENALL